MPTIHSWGNSSSNFFWILACSDLQFDGIFFESWIQNIVHFWFVNSANAVSFFIWLQEHNFEEQDSDDEEEEEIEISEQQHEQVTDEEDDEEEDREQFQDHRTG